MLLAEKFFEFHARVQKCHFGNFSIFLGSYESLEGLEHYIGSGYFFGCLKTCTSSVYETSFASVLYDSLLSESKVKQNWWKWSLIRSFVRGSTDYIERLGFNYRLNHYKDLKLFLGRLLNDDATIYIFAINKLILDSMYTMYYPSSNNLHVCGKCWKTWYIVWHLEKNI